VIQDSRLENPGQSSIRPRRMAAAAVLPDARGPNPYPLKPEFRLKENPID